MLSLPFFRTEITETARDDALSPFDNNDINIPNNRTRRMMTMTLATIAIVRVLSGASTESIDTFLFSVPILLAFVAIDAAEDGVADVVAEAVVVFRVAD